MKISQKIREQRALMNMSREELAQKAGVSKRTIIAYETEQRRPRDNILFRLASVLHVSIRYLRDDDCDDPTEDLSRDFYIKQAHDRYGSSAMRDMEELLEANMVFFAGGSISMEQKDEFYEAITQAYFDCRREASRKFGRKKKPDGDSTANSSSGRQSKPKTPKDDPDDQ